MILRFFRCVAKAAVKNGIKRLAELVGVEALYDFCKDVHEEYRAEHQEPAIRHDVELVAPLSADEARQHAVTVVNTVAPQLSAQEKQTLTGYLALIPAVMRQSLRHADDPTGKTVSPQRRFDAPDDLLDLLPRRAPRFHTGQRLDIIGGWVLVELLGAGGFGEVWKAHHPDYPATVAAFKFCLDEAGQDRLLRHEGKVINQVMGQKRHPGIVPLLNANLQVKPGWLQFEYIEGGDLANLVASWRSLSPSQRVRESADVILELADIVGHFHRLEPAVIHRDLKPANILLQSLHGRRSLRVADFGIGMIVPPATPQAKLSTPNASFGATIGSAYTPGYASPQQEKRQLPDVRDDVFALGVIWYQLLLGDLTRFRPSGWFWVEDLKAMGMSESAIKLLGGCIDDVPDRRPRDARDLADQLRKLPREDEVIEVAELAEEEEPTPPAKSLRQQLQELRADAQAKWARAEKLVKRHDYVAAVALLADVPAEFLDADRLTQWQQLAEEIKSLQHVLKAKPRDFLTDAKLREQAHRLVTIQPHLLDLKELLDELPSGKTTRKAGELLAGPFGMKFAWIPPGQFTMGSPAGEEGRYDNEVQHPVVLTKGFFLGVHPVTQAQWQAVMGNNPSHFKGEPLPVESVSWNDCVAFCKKLSERDGKKYRLPTEAEWESACRAGSQTAFSFGDNPRLLGEYAWFNENSGSTTHPVGQKKPNDWGLYDMHGNVWEWCADWYGAYPTKEATDPQGPSTGEHRLLRGGSWVYVPRRVRSANRYWFAPGGLDDDFGLRVCCCLD